MFAARIAIVEVRQVLKETTGIQPLLEPALEAMGFELLLVELVGSSSGQQILRVYIDAPGGIFLEDCQRVSYQVSAILDVEDPIKGEYTLEVSSPGLDRPLVKHEHFQRYRDSKVRIRTRTSHLGRRKFIGTLAEVGEKSVVVDVDGEPYELPFSDMERANLVGEIRDSSA